MSTLPSASIEAFQRDGAVYLPGLFRDWIDDIAAGIEQNMREPGPYAAENLTDDESGRFFDDYCNWRRIPAFGKVIHESGLAAAASQLMQSHRVQFFHEHVLVKEPGTDKALASGCAVLLR
jgi:ectoine hydroxylase-related dioxygenase (phytanoyl-CoA dioxygenase family)